MVYRKTSLSSLPCSCTNCSNFKETTVLQGGAISSHWFGCAILPTELLGLPSQISREILMSGRSPACPLAEIDER